MSSLFLDLFRSSQFNHNFMFSPQNQNFQNLPSSPWSTTIITPPQETSEIVVEVAGLQYADIDENVKLRAENAKLQVENAKLREENKKLQEQLEKTVQKKEQQNFSIQFLESEKLQLKQPLAVSLSFSPDEELWIVDCPELNLYGEGVDEIQAINDFKIVLEEFYFSLKKDKENLGAELKKKWNILQQIIEEK